MKILLSSCLAFVLIVAGASAQATKPFSWWFFDEPFVVLDDFRGDRIDENIWNGSRRPDADILDVAREVRGGKLRLMGRAYANTPPPGERNDPRVRLFLNNSGPVTQMAARVRVKAIEISGCTDSATVSTMRVRMGGFFFKTFGPGLPGDGTNDVFAAIRIWRRSDSLDPPGVMDIGTQVFLCGDPGCFGGETLVFENEALGKVVPGQSVLLVLVWDPDNDRFIFLRHSHKHHHGRNRHLIVNYNDEFGLTDEHSPSLVQKRLELRAQIENCETGPLASGFMDVFVNKVWVNQSAVSP